MQTLSQFEIAAIARELAAHARARGNQILGAQLGLLVTNVIRPRTLRELGGLRRLADEELSHVLHFVSTTPSDVAFEIKAESHSDSAPLATPSDPREVAGQELWRFYSNPNIRCRLAIIRPSKLYVLGMDGEFLPGATELKKPATDDFKVLAKQFADDQGEPWRTELLRTLEEPNFYNPWIACLKRHRSTESNFLRKWEALRTEYVANRLASSLKEGGIEDAYAAEIVAVARPIAAFKPQRPSSPPPLDLNGWRNVEPVEKVAVRNSDVDSLRRLIHRAVDQMSVAELREIRIPAGLMQDIVHFIGR